MYHSIYFIRLYRREQPGHLYEFSFSWSAMSKKNQDKSVIIVVQVILHEFTENLLSFIMIVMCRKSKSSILLILESKQIKYNIL